MRVPCILVFACALASVEARAAAQDGGYHDLVAAAVAEHQAGRYEEARALYLRAHGVSPNARTERALGMVEYELREYASAHRYLRDALGDPRNALTPELRAGVERLLHLTEARVGRVRVTLTPSDAELEIDGEPALREADGAILLDLGSHQLVATTDEGRASREIQIEGGEDLSVALEVRPVSADAAIGSSRGSREGGPLGREPVDHEPDGGHDVTGEWWLWTLIGAVVIGAGVGIGVGVATYDPGTRAPYPGTDGAVVMTLRVGP